VPFKSTTAWRKGHLNLFSELLAKKVALLSLHPSIEITRNPTTGSCLGFPLPPTAGKEKTHIFILQPLSTHRYQNVVQTPSRWVQPSPRDAGGCRYYWGALCLAARDGDPSQKLYTTTLGPPPALHPLLAGHLSPPVLAKVPVPRAAQL